MLIDPITRKEAIALLTQDDYYRRQRKWPLISYNDINISSYRDVSDDLFNIKTYRDTSTLSPLEKIIDIINILFPFTNELLTKFQNNLVACGGSICKSIIKSHDQYQHISDDIDFFFHDLDVFQANIMRIEIIEYMINIWKSNIGKKVSRNRGYGYNSTIIQDVKFYIQRNEYVTTLHVEELCDFNENPRVYMYQFIHRIYPDISTIIGGFDLSSSAVAYNGKEIFTTPLGAWSLINRSIIIDMGRRSTSYEHRLKKYNRYGFRLIFPGINKKIINDKLIKNYDNRAFFKFKAKIEKLARDNGYKTNFDLREVFYKDSYQHKYIDEYDRLAFHRLQKETDVLQHLILDLNYDNSICIKQSNGCQYDWWNPDDDNEEGRCKDKDYYLNKLSDYGNDEKYILEISDYSHNHMYYKHIPSANTTRLTLNNLNGVVSMLYIDNHQNIKEKLMNEVNNPNLGINDFVIELYKTKVDDSILDFQDGINLNDHCKQPNLIKCFGSFTSEIVNDCTRSNTNYINQRDLMIENIKKNDKICKDNLTGIKWITENPGRQWTSSINPIFKDPRDWYGKHYIPVFVGIPPEIETCMRLMRLERTESIWTILPKDMFDLLLSYILNAYANQAWEYIK
jgi:hypothetical protein